MRNRQKSYFLEDYLKNLPFELDSEISKLEAEINEVDRKMINLAQQKTEAMNELIQYTRIREALKTL